MSGSFRVCILLEEQSRYFKPERRLKFRVSRRLPEQISFSSDGIDAGLRVRRLQLLQSSSFSLEKREKSKSSRTTEEMFNFSTEELLGRLMELLLPQLLKEMSRSFSFLHEERSRLSRLLSSSEISELCWLIHRETAVHCQNSPGFSDYKNIRCLPGNRLTWKEY